MKFSKSNLTEQRAENIVVAIIMVAIIILSLVLFGWTTIKSWITTPLVWKGQDSLEAYYIGALPEGDSGEYYKLFFGIQNHTNQEIDDYRISLEIEGVKFDCASSSQDDIKAYGLTDIVLSVTTKEEHPSSQTHISKELLNKLINRPEDIPVSCKIKTLKSHGETIVNNNGWAKTIIIVVISLTFGILGFFGDISKQWLRVLFKLLATPAIISILIVLFIFAGIAYIGSPEGQAASEESRRKREAEERNKASREYKSAANTKAACIARGDYKGAAYAQERMDKSMADMVSGNGADKIAYKSAAHKKAAAAVRGDRSIAAYAQAEMDQKMADILKDK